MSKYKYNTSFRFNGKVYSVKANTYDELAQKIENKKKQLRVNSVMQSITVREWSTQAVELYKRHTDRYHKTYMGMLENHILKHIGSMRVIDVKPADIQSLMNRLETYSSTLINDTYNILHFVFEKAVDNDILIKSPCRGIEKPKGRSKKRRPITDTERETLYQLAEHDSRYMVFLFSLLCGCRPSEAYNLTSDDIVKEGSTVLLHIRGKKTDNADRYVPLPNYLYQRVKSANGLLVTNNGKPYTENSYNYMCKRLKKHMEKGFVSYDLRHTYGTDLAKLKVDERYTKYLMGHSSISTTVNIYTHLDKSVAVEMYNVLK